jgi:flagellar biosynthesis chaperone FliJ
MNTAMGIIGWIVMGVQLIGSALKAVYEVHDKRLENQIQGIQVKVSELEKGLEALEKALDDAFSTTQIEQFSRSFSDNIDRQIAHYHQMIALEDDKKKKDEDKINDYKEQIESLSEKRREMFDEQNKKVTGGIFDDILSAAENFVDVWYEAFQETGDGLRGLEDEFQEMMATIIKRQAAMQIVGNFTKKYSDWLKEYIDVERGDTVLSAEEAREWASRVKETMPKLNALLENFFMGTQELMQGSGELSDLNKGIQGVTESTAQVIEALLNSMRFYVADSNVRLRNIESVFANDDIATNPLLNELRQQTALVRSIEEMFSSVIGRGSGTHSGAYLKVLM